MADTFPTSAQLSWEPGARHYAVTPHDSTDFTASFRALYIGTGGDVVIVDMNSTAVTYKNVPAGTVIPMRGRRVNSTSTTATDIVGIY